MSLPIEIKYLFLKIKNYEPNLAIKIMEYLFTDTQKETNILINNSYRINEVLVFKYVFGIELDENPQLELCRYNCYDENNRFFDLHTYKFNKFNFRIALKECIAYNSIYHDKFIKNTKIIIHKYRKLLEILNEVNIRQDNINQLMNFTENNSYRPSSPIQSYITFNREEFMREYKTEIKQNIVRLGIKIEERKDFIDKTVVDFIF